MHVWSKRTLTLPQEGYWWHSSGSRGRYSLSAYDGREQFGHGRALRRFLQASRKTNWRCSKMTDLYFTEALSRLLRYLQGAGCTTHVGSTGYRHRFVNTLGI